MKLKENNDTIVVHVIPVDGPYKIMFDGQSGGHFVWSDCGLELNFPPGCSDQQIEISISVFLPIRNMVYLGVYIVSAVYQFQCNVERFDKMFTLRLQHCVKLQSAEDCHKMCFIIQHGGNNMKYGCFEIGSSYGTVTLDRFCYVYTGWIYKLWRSIQIQIISDSDDQDSEDDQGNEDDQSGEDDQNNQDSSSVIISNQRHGNSLQTASNVSQSDSGACSKPPDSQQLNLVPVPLVTTNASSDSLDEGQKKPINISKPVFEYEQLLALPKHHSHLINWSGAYCIHKKGWRKVCKFIVSCINR